MLSIAAFANFSEASDLTVNGAAAAQVLGGSQVDFALTANPGLLSLIAVDIDPGPQFFLGELIPIGITPSVAILGVGTTDSSGVFDFSSATPPGVSATLYFIGLAFDATDPNGLDFSNNVELTLLSGSAPIPEPLAGNSLSSYPDFNFVTAFNMNSPVEVGIDPARIEGILDGETVDLYVTEAQTADEWTSNPTLTDVSGNGVETVVLSDSDLESNRFTVDAGTLNGIDGAEIGVGYDLIVDRNQNGLLDGNDLIDGFGDEAGLYVVRDVTLPGPYNVLNEFYSGGLFLGQDTFYPENIAELGPRPLVVISHGAGHVFTWYDHIGAHLASYGFVVMSHSNNVGPGIDTAASTTLANVDFMLGNLDTILDGEFEGLIAVDQMIWLGHSRGGEGVVRAYDLIFDGTFTPEHYSLSDIKLISSMAPTDFLGTDDSTPHDVNYHLWVGGADNDVNGCAQSDIVQPFHLHDRAEGQRQTISLHGAGHADFHNGPTGSVAAGPCLLGRPTTHAIMRGYILPLFTYHLTGAPAAKDFLTRQWENFHPIGAPAQNPCVVVDLTFTEGPKSGKRVIDDFQSNPSPALASSGAVVTTDAVTLSEGRFDDNNTDFTNDGDPFNGFTLGNATDTTAGIAVRFSAGDASLSYELQPADHDWTGFETLSFRAAQSPRRGVTTAVLGDALFDVRITDGSGNSSTISIGAYGGGIEEPYQRLGCGIGIGWAAEMETIRLPIRNYLTDSTNVDLSDVRILDFLFGPSHGEAAGFFGLDDIELTVQ